MNNTRVKKIGIWALAITLFGFQLLFRSVGYADAPQVVWEEVCTKTGECQVAFPAKPQLIQQSLPLADGVSRLTYDVYLAPHEDKGVFLLLVATYPSPVANGNETAGLEGLLSGIVNHNPENKLVYAELVDLLGHPAVTFLVNGGSSYFRGQAVMVGNKLYLLAMEGLQDEMDESVFEKFVQSFRLDR